MDEVLDKFGNLHNLTELCSLIAKDTYKKSCLLHSSIGFNWILLRLADEMGTAISELRPPD